MSAAIAESATGGISWPNGQGRFTPASTQRFSYENSNMKTPRASSIHSNMKMNKGSSEDASNFPSFNSNDNNNNNSFFSKNNDVNNQIWRHKLNLDSSNQRYIASLKNKSDGDSSNESNDFGSLDYSYNKNQSHLSPHERKSRYSSLLYESLCSKKMNRMYAFGAIIPLLVGSFVLFVWQLFFWNEPYKGLFQLFFGFEFYFLRTLFLIALIIPYIAYKKLFHASFRLSGLLLIKKAMTYSALCTCSFSLMGFILLKDYFGTFFLSTIGGADSLLDDQVLFVNMNYLHLLIFFVYLGVARSIQYFSNGDYILHYDLKLTRRSFWLELKSHMKQMLEQASIISFYLFVGFLPIYYVFQGWIFHIIFYLPQIFLYISGHPSSQLELSGFSLLLSMILSSIVINYLWELCCFVADFQLTRNPRLHEKMDGCVLSVIPGIYSKRPYIQNVAFAELYDLLRSSSSQRHLIFNDLDNCPTSWILLKEACITMINRIYCGQLDQEIDLFRSLSSADDQTFVPNDSGLKRAKLLTVSEKMSSNKGFREDDKKNLFKTKSKGFWSQFYSFLTGASVEATTSIISSKLSLNDPGKENLVGKLPPSALIPREPSTSLATRHSLTSVKKEQSSLDRRSILPSVLLELRRLSFDVPPIKSLYEYILHHYRESLFAGDVFLIVMAIKNIKLMVVASYEEDIFGLIQRDLKNIVEVILDAIISTEELLSTPAYSCNGSISISSIYEALYDTMQDFIGVFSTHLQNLDLSVTRRAKLHQLTRSSDKLLS